MRKVRLTKKSDNTIIEGELMFGLSYDRKIVIRRPSDSISKVWQSSLIKAINYSDSPNLIIFTQNSVYYLEYLNEA